MPIHQGEKLKEAVDASKLRVLDISRLSEIPVSSLYDIFKKEDVPRKKLEKLCEVLGLNINDMYFPASLLQDTGSDSFKHLETEVVRLRTENELLRQRIADMEKIITLMNEVKNHSDQLHKPDNSGSNIV